MNDDKIRSTNIVKTFEKVSNNEFQCIISTIGFGKSKREAEEQAILNLNFNSIGKLIEICIKNKWKLPIFEELQTTGTLHDKIYNYSCCITINNTMHTMFGTGSSKTQSKKDAAWKLINMISRLPKT
jgi:Double-stranded RNA binding motif